jgi:hypothetical protein
MSQNQRAQKFFTVLVRFMRQRLQPKLVDVIPANNTPSMGQRNSRTNAGPR